MWPTTDRKVVLDALKRLSGVASGKEQPAQAG
jgi:hypothetical protein